MSTQKSGAALPGRPTTEPHRPVTVLPPIIHQGDGNVKVSSAKEVEELLTVIWGEPAFVIPCWVGGHGPQYFARSEGHWLPMECDARGFILLTAQEDADYDPHFSLRLAVQRGVV